MRACESELLLCLVKASERRVCMMCGLRPRAVLSLLVQDETVDGLEQATFDFELRSSSVCDEQGSIFKMAFSSSSIASGSMCSGSMRGQRKRRRTRLACSSLHMEA